MNELFCSKHAEVRLTNVLAGGAGYCSACSLFVQSAGVPEPARPTPRPPIEEARKIKARLASAKRRAAKAPAPAPTAMSPEDQARAVQIGTVAVVAVAGLVFY